MVFPQSLRRESPLIGVKSKESSTPLDAQRAIQLQVEGYSFTIRPPGGRIKGTRYPCPKVLHAHAHHAPTVLHHDPK